MRKPILALILAATLAGCTTTPTTPPPSDLPAATLAQLDVDRWWTAFDDPTLTALVEEALANNLDLAAAIARIDLARAQLLLAQSPLFPDVRLGVDAGRDRVSSVGRFPIEGGGNTIGNDYRVGLNASYEVDLWGKFRAGAGAARSDLVASQYARETVRTVVAAEVARAYFSLLATDAQLALLKETLATREETVTLQRDRYQAGVIGEFDLKAAEAERAAVASDIAFAQRLDAQLEAALAVLLGRSPRAVFEPQIGRDVATVRLLAVPTIPAGLPSDLLERRPDIRRVEQQFAAASLRVDAARADYFPSLSLTGTYGTESGSLRNLFTGPSLVWGIAASLVQQVAGLKVIEANVQAQTSRREALLVDYRQAVQAAFRETHDALVANRTTRDALAAQAERRQKLTESLELANLRYTSGYSPYLEVLDVQRQLLQAQTLQVLAARDVRLAVVDLAKALGGGWNYKTAVAQ